MRHRRTDSRRPTCCGPRMTVDPSGGLRPSGIETSWLPLASSAVTKLKRTLRDYKTGTNITRVSLIDRRVADFGGHFLCAARCCPAVSVVVTRTLQEVGDPSR